MIKIKDLHKSYKMGSNSLHVLKGINFEVEEGELVAIMGSSGSGKSTLLNILGMLDLLDEGSYDLDGVPIRDLDETKAANYRNKFLGFVFQSFNLINYKTALENVTLPLYYQGVKRKESPILSQFTGFLVKKPKTPEHAEFDRLNFQYQDLVRWDESPSLSLAYKELVDLGLKGHRSYIESIEYQNMNDYQKAEYWRDTAIFGIRSTAREHLKARFPDRFSDDNLYDSLNIIRSMSQEKRLRLESEGVIDKLSRDGYNSKELEQQMKDKLLQDYEKYGINK